jgi:hypothetical protein
MRRETSKERAVWTAFVDGETNETPKGSKYGNKRVPFNGKQYDSQREANQAATLQTLFSRGKILA